MSKRVMEEKDWMELYDMKLMVLHREKSRIEAQIKELIEVHAEMITFFNNNWKNDEKKPGGGE